MKTIGKRINVGISLNIGRKVYATIRTNTTGKKNNKNAKKKEPTAKANHTHAPYAIAVCMKYDCIIYFWAPNNATSSE